jgi:hypothetical protein
MKVFLLIVMMVTPEGKLDFMYNRVAKCPTQEIMASVLADMKAQGRSKDGAVLCIDISKEAKA